ncbi:MAG: hypothetical protein HFJ04_08415 [Lachnospiraceae bacterium]|nr:hypothetical protein [Lachnospiraceae bacterium]
MTKEKSEWFDWIKECGNRRELYIYLLGILFICIIIALHLPGAYYHRAFTHEDFKCKKGTNPFAVKEEDTESEGVFMEGPGMSFEKGDYLVTVTYAANSDKNYLSFETKIRSETVEAEAAYMLPANESWGTAAIPLHLNAYTEKLNFNIYYGGSGDLNVTDIVVDGLDFRPGDVLAIGFLALFFYLLAGYALVLRKMRGGVFPESVLLFLAAALSSYPYCSGSLFAGDDISFHLMRIAGIRDGILSGQFPVRIYPEAFYGTGYNCSLYYPDFFLYIPALLCLLGVSIALSVQIFGFLIHLAAAGAMYYAARKLKASKTAGLVSAVLYVFSGYFCHNLFFRCDLGESVAMCFFPLVICGFYAAVFLEKNEWGSLCIGMTGIVLSHILSALIAAFLLLVFGVCSWKKVCRKKAFLALLESAAASIGLCAWFLAPFLEAFQIREWTNIAFMMKPVDNNVIEVGRIFGGFEGGHSKSLGMALALGTILSFYCIFSADRAENRNQRNRILVLLAAGLGTAACATAIFPWDVVMNSMILHDIVALIQFPWRLLGPASAFLSLAAGLAAGELLEKISPKALLSAVFMICFTLFAFRVDTYIYQEEEIYMRHGDALLETEVAEDYLFRSTDTQKLMWAKPEIPEAGIELIRYEKNGCNVNMEVSAQAGAYVDADLLLFTGYKAFDDSGNELPCTFGENNRLRIQFPAAYEGKVLVRYTGRLRWRVTDGVSFFLLLFLLASRICRKKQDSGSRSGRSVHSVRI